MIPPAGWSADVEFTERFPADRRQRFNSPLLRRWSKLRERLMAAGR